MRIWGFSSRTEPPRSGTTSAAFVARVRGLIVLVQSLLEASLPGQGAELDHDRVEFLAAGPEYWSRSPIGATVPGDPLPLSTRPSPDSENDCARQVRVGEFGSGLSR
jgi:hypothetical protein